SAQRCAQNATSFMLLLARRGWLSRILRKKGTDVRCPPRDALPGRLCVAAGASFDRGFLVLAAHLRLQPTEVIRIPVDKLATARQRGMNLGNLFPHFLHDEPVVGMTLGHGSQLTDVYGFTQVELHIPTDTISKRDDILGFKREVAGDLFVQLRGLLHTAIEGRLEPRGLDLRRSVVAVGSSKVLSLLREHTVSLQVAIQSKIPHNVERVIHLL